MPQPTTFVPMPLERQEEIALLHLKSEMRRNGIKLEDLKRRVGAQAKELGLDTGEAMLFVETLTRQLVDEAFKK